MIGCFLVVSFAALVFLMPLPEEVRWRLGIGTLLAAFLICELIWNRRALEPANPIAVGSSIGALLFLFGSSARAAWRRRVGRVGAET